MEVTKIKITEKKFLEVLSFLFKNKKVKDIFAKVFQEDSEKCQPKK